MGRDPGLLPEGDLGTMNVKTKFVVVAMSAWLGACGGIDATPESADSAPQRDRGMQMQVGGTIGGMDAHAVRAVMAKVRPKVSRCVRNGRERLPVLGGEVRIDLTVGRNGRVREAFLDSTLGDHDVEACVVGAFRAQQWPRPVGGVVGKIGQELEFTSGHDEPPLDWSANALRDGMADDADRGERPFDDMLTTLNQCRVDASAGPMKVTMYLDEDGFVQSAGLGMSDAQGKEAVDCILTTVQTTSFPAPEENIAKVTVDVR